MNRPIPSLALATLAALAVAPSAEAGKQQTEVQISEVATDIVITYHVLDPSSADHTCLRVRADGSTLLTKGRFEGIEVGTKQGAISRDGLREILLDVVDSGLIDVDGQEIYRRMKDASAPGYPTLVSDGWGVGFEIHIARLVRDGRDFGAVDHAVWFTEPGAYAPSYPGIGELQALARLHETLSRLMRETRSNGIMR